MASVKKSLTSQSLSNENVEKKFGCQGLHTFGVSYSIPHVGSKTLTLNFINYCLPSKSIPTILENQLDLINARFTFLSQLFIQCAMSEPTLKENELSSTKSRGVQAESNTMEPPHWFGSSKNLLTMWGRLGRCKFTLYSQPLVIEPN